MHTTNEKPEWGPIRKLLMLFFVVYFVLYIFPFPVEHFGRLSSIFSFYDDGISWLTMWIGQHILHLSKLEEIEMTGSGDTTFDYVNVLTHLSLAFILTSVLFVFIRRRSYERAFAYAQIYFRYYLAAVLIGYGIAKFQSSQFPIPTYSRMETPVGQMSPMGLLWTLMGYSMPYSIFTGVLEMVAGYLLLFRRSTVAGAILATAFMTNVFMLNMSYDVPVKLYSAHLLLLAVVILVPYLHSIVSVFFLGRSTAFTYEPLILPARWMRIVRILLKGIIIILAPCLLIAKCYWHPKGSEATELDGAYYTTSFVVNEDTLAPLTTDTARWSKLLMSRNAARVTLMNDKYHSFRTEIDPQTHTLKLISFSDSTDYSSFHYQLLNDSTMKLTGSYDEDSINAVFKRKQRKDYPLMQRGFHWINEYPYNR